jgi:arylsulfatase A-like enzyme
VYDEEIAYTDYWVDRLLTALADRHPGHETVCVVTADHGEFFGEHGRFLHGRDVYQPVIHVPLIIGGGINEELQGSAVEMPVALRNVPQTILHLAGVDNAPFAGADLLSIAHTSGFPAYVFTEASYPFGEDDRKTAVQDGTWKLIHNLDPDTYELYCLDTDPGELENLWHAEAPQAIEQKEQLAKVLQEFNERATVTAPQTTLSDDTLEHLRSLGYTR